MKRIFAHYSNWEDFKAGMYRLPSVQDSPVEITMSKLLLSDCASFFLTGLSMIQNWPVSSSVNLSNRSRNRQAWMGQASCCYAYGAAEHSVKEAWHLLSSQQQAAANATADEVIKLWENWYA